ncbi:MAG TPA: iron-containing alcohol dehydrogenase [Bryobacteraceae bacterium]|nr:iron-containing alcohol dehydrogenase [Bryobacteraceae bacterium]
MSLPPIRIGNRPDREPGGFEFATAGRILFGAGKVKELEAAAAAFGRAPLLVTRGAGASACRAFACRFSVTGEPTLDLIRQGTELAHERGCDVVIAMGGGSALDAGKAIAAMIANPGDPLDYLEVIGRGQPLQNDPAPCIAVPTTAGTGSEVTRNAVLGSVEHRVKASLRSVRMLPRLAIVDPELTLSLPPAVTASTGLDALTQVIEPYVSVRANAMTDMFCIEGMRAATALPRVWKNGADREGRSAMAWAALLGGLSLANAGLGAVHGFAAPIGGMFAAPHGAVCAALLPHAMAINIQALRSRDPNGRALERYSHVAVLLTGKSNSTPEDGARWVAELCRSIEIPPLRQYGVQQSDIPVLVEKAARASSMKGNPIVLEEGELREILERAI